MIKKGDVFKAIGSDYSILITKDENRMSEMIEWEPNSWVLDIPPNTTAKCYIPRNELLAHYLRIDP